MTNEVAVSRWQDAVNQLRIAAEAIDQAHAMIRDLKIHNYIETGRGPYRQTLNSAYGIVNGLLRDLENVRCPECDEPMSARPACLAGNCPAIDDEPEGCDDCMTYPCSCDVPAEVLANA